MSCAVRPLWWTADAPVRPFAERSRHAARASLLMHSTAPGGSKSVLSAMSDRRSPPGIGTPRLPVRLLGPTSRTVEAFGLGSHRSADDRRDGLDGARGGAVDLRSVRRSARSEERRVGK